jgi:hypothetical protein
MLYAHSFIVRLLLCMLLTAPPLLIHPPVMLLAQQIESLGTGVIPTMRINGVTEGTLQVCSYHRDCGENGRRLEDC